MVKQTKTSYQLALRDFQNARQQAAMQQLLARIRGEDTGLLPYDEIEEKMHATGEIITHGTQEIPLDKIVGSVSRYKDFTRSFLPKRDSDKERWTGVRAAVNDMTGIPPIKVYQLGDAYFVQDGNHRVSIARRLDSQTITAHVTEVKTRVPFAADDDPNEIICKENYADFLALTNLDQLRPDVDLMMTFCGHYQIFVNQIESRSAALKDGQHSVKESELWTQAVIDWYDNAYLPVISIVREIGVLHHFPYRTEADMYLLLSERQDELEHDLGWQVEKESGVSDLIAGQKAPRGMVKRLIKTIKPPQALEWTPGLWRQQQQARNRDNHLFKHILIEVDGTEENWLLIDHFFNRTNFDKDHILGLHVVPDEETLASDAVGEMRARFDKIIQSRGLKGDFAVEVGSNPTELVNQRAAWVDLVVIRGTRLPNNQILSSASAELKLLVEKCPRPIQVIPDGTKSDYSRGLLAYDGSPKSDEALFIATYLTAKWHKKLTVVTVETAYTNSAAVERARHYLLKRGLTDVQYILKKGSIADMVLETAQEQDCNLLYLGGFSFRSLRTLSLGSSAERILLEFPDPMWICR